MQPWQPHIYRRAGMESGVDSDTIDAATSDVEALLSISPRLTPIMSLGHLASSSGVSYKYLRTIVSRRAKDAYVNFSIIGRSGRARRISTPSRDLMVTQRWIADNILRHVERSPHSFAYHNGLSIVECARRHCGSRWLIKLDVARFFQSILETQVYRIFAQLGYRPLVAFEMARICTWPSDGPSFDHPSTRERGPSYGWERSGSLPIGAPTSPMLSNAFMRPFDFTIASYCVDNNLVYSRYADDLFISSGTRTFGRDDAENVARRVRAELASSGLTANKAKTTIVPPGARKVVLSMLVDGETPRLSPEFKKRMRMHYYFLRRYGIKEHAERRGFPSPSMLQEHLRGLIAFASQIEPVYAANLMMEHRSFSWL